MYHQPFKAPKRATLVGEYILWSGDSGEPSPPDRLTLETNGRYVLVHMHGNHAGAKEEGRWQLFHDDLGWNLALGNHTYPIELNGQNVHLLVDDDLNIWYAKSAALQGHE